MEYWSYGVLERIGNSADFQNLNFPSLHNSATPFLPFYILRRQRCRFRRHFATQGKEFNDTYNDDPKRDEENYNINYLQERVMGGTEFNLVHNNRPNGHHRHKNRRQSGDHPFQTAPGLQIEGDNN